MIQDTSQITKELLRDEIRDYCKANVPLVYISYKFNNQKYELTDKVRDLEPNKLMEQYESYFANIPFNCSDCWIGILAGEVASLLPIGFLDIFTGDVMEQSMTDRKLVRLWIESEFCISTQCKLAKTSRYPYVLQHFKTQHNALTPNLTT